MSNTTPAAADLQEQVQDLLADGSLLARSFAGFRPRREQLAMAMGVARCLDAGESLICEAGTGTGKTLAYLVPAVLSGLRVLVSTATRTLQDQLFEHDLPHLRAAVERPFSVALLKGRSNYLCVQRLSQALAGGPAAPAAAELQHVRDWAERTVDGDIAEVAEVAEDAAVWPLVTSTSDNCLGQECPRFQDCHVLKARRRAQSADLIVVNHHLLMADLALREEGFGELLPGVDAVIVDEAHQLPETAARFLGTTVSSRQLSDLARDALTARAAEAPDMADLDDRADALAGGVLRLRAALPRNDGRFPWGEVLQESALSDDVSRIRARLDDLRAALEQAAERGKRLEACARRAGAALQRLDLIAGDTAPTDTPLVRWVETRGRGFLWHATPVELGVPFQARAARYGSPWVFTSATLAVQGRFDHFRQQLGIEHAHELLLPSPYDYAQQTLLYLPPLGLDPRTPGYLDAFLDMAVRVLEASGGRAFMLFTSHRALGLARERLKTRVPFPLFVQGSAPRATLLSRFKASRNGVLLGTSSFWEGVDVRGSALSCVIIDKLPFASPDDPVLKARSEMLRERGLNPFWEDQLPAAVIALKQGVGRLIRDERDRGVLVIGDPRIREKSYGQAFLNSLPPMPQTSRLEDVAAFFACETAP